MSGGSFEYMYVTDQPRTDLLERMLAELEALAADGRPGALEAAERTREYIKPHDDPVRKVWRAIEWWRSCDYGPEEVLAALEDYRETVT